MKQVKKYVVGFMFSQGLDEVVLIRKNRPLWQKGLYNGVGGKVEEDEHQDDAMQREFEEETGCDTHKQDWKLVSKITDEDPDETPFEIYFYTIVGNLARCKTTTDEEIVIMPLTAIYPTRRDMMANLPWSIGMALDALRKDGPEMSWVSYGKAKD